MVNYESLVKHLSIVKPRPFGLLSQQSSPTAAILHKEFPDRTQCLCRSLARQKAVKAGTVLQQAEMQQLVADLFCCSMPGTSPSGKKTMIILTPDELFR